MICFVNMLIENRWKTLIGIKQKKIVHISVEELLKSENVTCYKIRKYGDCSFCFKRF